MTHTQGPWSYIGNGDVVAKSEKYCGGEKDIASVFLTVNDEDEANARLIAAAPELLRSLKDFSDYVRNEQNSTDGAVTYSNTQINRLVFYARAAIAKATGGDV